MVWVEARSPPVSMIDKVIGSAAAGRAVAKATAVIAVRVASDIADSRAHATGTLRIWVSPCILSLSASRPNFLDLSNILALPAAVKPASPPIDLLQCGSISDLIPGKHR